MIAAMLVQSVATILVVLGQAPEMRMSAPSIDEVA
jgi:hypothetical protein